MTFSAAMEVHVLSALFPTLSTSSPNAVLSTCFFGPSIVYAGFSNEQIKCQRSLIKHSEGKATEMGLRLRTQS
jgi:hypothetical protein